MGVKNSYGLAKLELGTYSTVDGTATNFVEYPVYKDTMVISEAEPTATKHFQAGKVHPIVVNLQGGEEVASFTIMDTQADTMATLLGGTVTTVGQVKTWKKATGQPTEIIKVLRATTLDGRVITISRGSLMAKKNLDLGDAKLAGIDVKVTVTETGFSGVAPMTITEAV